MLKRNNMGEDEFFSFFKSTYTLNTKKLIYDFRNYIIDAIWHN